MKRKNIVAMVTSLALVGVVAVGGTLALLTAPTNDVVNTFAVGKGYDQDEDNPDVYLDEALVTQSTDADTLGDYVETTEPRVKSNTYDKLVEHASLAKDPQFHIAAKCEVAESWIVAKVSGFNTGDGVTTLKFTDVTDETEATSENGIVDGTWYKVTKSGESYSYAPVTLENIDNGVYIYNAALAAGKSTKDLFQQLQVDNFVPGQNPSTITVSGCAVEGIVGMTYDQMKDNVMKQVDTWAFGT